MRGGKGRGVERRSCLVSSCTTAERLEPGVFDTRPAVSFEQLADVQHLGAVLNGLGVAAQLVAHQSPVCPQLLVVFAHVDAIAVQMQRLLQVSLLERRIALHLQLVGPGAPLQSVLGPLVAAPPLLQFAVYTLLGCAHVFLHGLELCGVGRRRRRQLFVLVVAVVEVVPLDNRL